MVNYYLMTKPGIIMGNLITVATGFVLGSRGHFDFLLFLATILGLGFVIASACVFNNYIDRDLDRKMERTKQRALAAGRISTANALLFATLLGLIGFTTLGTLTNPLTVSVASIGFAVYVVLYSMWKGKTIYATAIGSIAGATPPLVGYCAASNQFDLGASILFAVLVFWQMPHFFSIAMYRFTDYSKAAIPVLPIVKGSYCAKKRMLGYILAFIISATALTFFEFTSNYYMTSITLLGIAWLALCLKGFYTSNENKWAYQMFVFSLVTINGLCLMIAIDAMTHW